MNVELARTERLMAGDFIEDVNRRPQYIVSIETTGDGRFDIVLSTGRVLRNNHPLTLWRLR